MHVECQHKWYFIERLRVEYKEGHKISEIKTDAIILRDWNI